MLSVPGPAGLARLFSTDYSQARTRFVEAVRAVFPHASLVSVPHPATGPSAEPLWLDHAWLGPADASRVLVTQSGVHGVEGLAGSAIQLDHLLNGDVSGLPADTAVLHIHAVNPHGFAWARRVNEDGVDLNRNFVDFAAPLPENPDYDTVAPLLVPQDEASWEAADRKLADLERQWGSERFQKAASGGQYTDPAGPFYGGREPTWSRRQLEKLFSDLDLRSRAAIGVLDLHTGLGPFGYGELICDHPQGSAGVRTARRWYGDNVAEPALGTSSSVPKNGLIDYGWQDAFGDSVCFVTLEFGSYNFENLMTVLRKDQAVFGRPGTAVDHGKSRAVRESMLGHFYPVSRSWQESVIFRSRQVLDMALAGLVSEGR